MDKLMRLGCREDYGIACRTCNTYGPECPKRRKNGSSLRRLSGMLEKHYGTKVIVLIDEYDVPLAKAHANGYYEQTVPLVIMPGRIFHMGAIRLPI